MRSFNCPKCGGEIRLPETNWENEDDLYSIEMMVTGPNGKKIGLHVLAEGRVFDTSFDTATRKLREKVKEVYTIPDDGITAKQIED